MEKLQLQLPKKEKLQFFLLFVLLSFIFWAITKFSNTYQIQRPFEVSFSDVPDHIILEDDIKTINISITTSGFELVLYELFNKKISVPFKEAQKNGDQGVIALDNLSFDIQKQLFDNTVINSFDTKNIHFKYFTQKRKRLPLRFNKTVNFRPGYLLDQEWKLTPDSVWVTGSDKILDTLLTIPIQPYNAQDVANDILVELPLQSIEGLRYSEQVTQLSAKVSRYSEISFDVTIQIENQPENIRVKIFPPRVTITSIIRLDELNKYQADDFTIACNYLEMTDQNVKAVPLYAVNIPEGVKKISWNLETVDFLIRQ